MRALGFAALLAACNFSGPGVDTTGGDGDGDGDGGAVVSPEAATPVAARCQVTPAEVVCNPRISTVTAGFDSRDVYWQMPTSPPPADGYPVAIVYQGSFFGPASTWGTVAAGAPFGGYHQARMQALLLEAGYTVIAPSAAAGIAWQTNSGIPWEATGDKGFIDALLDAVADGDFGPADPSKLHATGISSGGYMTSRMAVSYPGRFRALAIASASYATCAGAICAVPDTMPSAHPRTLFLHGELDLTVPIATAEVYHERLEDVGVPTAMIKDADAGHEWLASAPVAIVDWFR